MFYKMRGKIIESTEYFFRNISEEDKAAILKITFTDGTAAFIESYIDNYSSEPTAALKVHPQ